MEAYTVLSTIGRGTFGVVSRARCVEDGREVCIKTIPMTGDGLDEAKNEVSIIERLDHPHVIHYIDSFYHDMALCIVMEYADGGDLSKVIEQANESHSFIPEKDILRWFYQLLSALAYIHEQGVLHRDIKPANILIRHGNVLLGDFGVSKVLVSGGPSIAVTGVGTVAYMAPETMSGCTKAASDIWAAGCVMWELMSGKPLFRATNMAALIAKVCTEADPPWELDEEREAYYTPELIEAIQWMLTRDVAKRPTAQELLQSPIFMEMETEMEMETGIQAQPNVLSSHSSYNRRESSENNRDSMRSKNPTKSMLSERIPSDFSELSSPYGNTFYRNFEKDSQEIERRMRAGSTKCNEYLTNHSNHSSSPSLHSGLHNNNIKSHDASAISRSSKNNGKRNVPQLTRHKTKDTTTGQTVLSGKHSSHHSRGVNGKHEYKSSRSDKLERSQSLKSNKDKPNLYFPDDAQEAPKKQFLVRKSVRLDDKEIKHKNALLKKHMNDPKNNVSHDDDALKPWKQHKSRGTKSKGKKNNNIDIDIYVKEKDIDVPSHMEYDVNMNDPYIYDQPLMPEPEFNYDMPLLQPQVQLQSQEVLEQEHKYSPQHVSASVVRPTLEIPNNEVVPEHPNFLKKHSSAAELKLNAAVAQSHSGTPRTNQKSQEQSKQLREMIKRKRKEGGVIDADTPWGDKNEGIYIFTTLAPDAEIE